MSGGLLLGIITFLSEQGALLVLLGPVVAAVLGSQFAVSFYKLLSDPTNERHQIKGKRLASDRTIETVLSVLGAVVLFAIAFDVLNAGRGFFDSFLPLEVETTVLVQCRR